MKKTIFAAIAVLLSLTAVYVCQAKIADASKISVTGDFDSVIRCRCKRGGCYGGNAISFRGACAKSRESIQCYEFEANCD
ncbi:MAG: hypothetical protein ACI3ZO_00375 [Candidatus Cryptobacteroides sp.]|nr:hypothetical protein [Bacteroidales bacterium]